MPENLHRIIVILAVCIFCTNADAARTSRDTTPHLKFSNRITELSGIGLKLRILDEAGESPVPPPTSYLYIKTIGSQESKVEMFAPEEIWKLGQSRGQWTDKYGNSMLLAVIKTPLPSGFQRQHIEMQEYEAALAKAGGERNDWTEKDLREWVAKFLNVDSVTSQPVNPPSFHILRMFEFLLPNAPAPVSYAFQLNPKAASVFKPDDTWFFIAINTPPTMSALKARQIIAASLLPSISAAKKADSTLKTASSDFQNKKVDSKTYDSSPEFTASKKRVAESISNMKDWWYAETRNYIFLSNLGISHKVFIKSMQEEMETLHEAYVKLIPPQVPINAVSVVRVFANETEYEDYVGNEYKWTGGLWYSAKKEMIIRSPQSTSSKFNREVIRRVIYHEGLHQYLHYAMDQLRSSPWFNEGHAVFFENGVIKSRYFDADEDARHAESIEKMIVSGALDIPALLKMDYPAFYAPDEKKRNDNYALAWGLIYYLRKYAPLEKPANHANILDAYLKSLWTAKDDTQATTEAFKNTNMHNLTRDFVSFWQSKNSRGYAKRNLLFK